MLSLAVDLAYAKPAGLEFENIVNVVIFICSVSFGNFNFVFFFGVSSKLSINTVSIIYRFNDVIFI